MFESLRSRAVKPAGSDRTVECPKCQDMEGYITRNEEGYEVWTFCVCRQRKRIERLFKSSQITEGFRKLGFRNFKTAGRPQPVIDAYECAELYLKSFKQIRNERQNSIALLGEPGSGKTHLLMAISNNLIQKHGIQVIYFPWVEVWNEIRDNLDLLQENIYRLQRAEVLFIDDLFKGRETPTDFQLEQLFAIVNYRYLNNLPMLVSSERDIDQLCEIDTAIGSRIYEMARDYCVILRGEGLNYRINAGAS